MEEIEKPMKMNYRESYAWQLGWAKGYDACRTEYNNWTLGILKILEETKNNLNEIERRTNNKNAY